MARIASRTTLYSVATFIAVAEIGCSAPQRDYPDDDAGVGGKTATGGTHTAPGKTLSVGGSSTGGFAPTGGVGGLESSGGTSAVGGSSGTAGDSTAGGASGVAGSQATGGNPGGGGNPSTLTGGNPGTGTGGMTGTGGSAITSGGTSAVGGTSTILVTGGTPTAGGAATGGATAGGASSTTTASTGGAATGGKTSAGGAPPTGGATTGGAPPTGGAATGGATTGGAAPSALSVAPNALTFGAILLNGKSQASSLTVTNKGGVASSVISTSLAAGPFTLASDACKNVSLAPNATCTMGVTFNPTSGNGNQTSTLTVSATTGGSLNIGLSGSAVALSLDQSAFTFPATGVNSVSASRSFTVSNPSIIAAGSTTGLAVTFTGTAKDEYHVDSSTCTGSLGASGTCSVIVSFRPLTFGARTATMTIGATPGGSASATLTGQGQAADGQLGCTSRNDCQSGVCLTYYQDADSDTYGDPAKPVSICGNSVPTGCVANADDCSDSNPNMHHNTSICGNSTQRKYCLEDAVLRSQDCTGGCMDGACVGTVAVAGTFTCDTALQCTTAQGCSWSGTPASPGTAPACNMDNSSANAITCDDSSDCGAGQVCCLNTNCGLTTKTTCFTGTTCPSGGMCNSYDQLCNPMSPSCPTGTACKRHEFYITTGQGVWICQ